MGCREVSGDRDRFGRKRDWFVDEEYEEKIRELLGSEVVDFARSVSAEELARGAPSEEEKFIRLLKLAEELGGRIVEALTALGDRELEGESQEAAEAAERAGAFLEVFGGLVRYLSNRHLFDHAVKLNARIPWLSKCEFTDPGGPYEFTLVCDYTRETNWKDMVAISPREAYEAVARNAALLDEYDLATIAYELHLEGEDELAAKLLPPEEAEKKWFELKNMLSDTYERRKLPGRRAR